MNAFKYFFNAGRITAADSLFTYILGQSADTFNNHSFTPVLDISELPFANMAGVEDVCGDSLECLFDVGATGDLEVGQVAMEVQITYNEIVEVSEQSKYSFLNHVEYFFEPLLVHIYDSCVRASMPEWCCLCGQWCVQLSPHVYGRSVRNW